MQNYCDFVISEKKKAEESRRNRIMQSKQDQQILDSYKAYIAVRIRSGETFWSVRPHHVQTLWEWKVDTVATDEQFVRLCYLLASGASV